MSFQTLVDLFVGDTQKGSRKLNVEVLRVTSVDPTFLKNRSEINTRSPNIPKKMRVPLWLTWPLTGLMIYSDALISNNRRRRIPHCHSNLHTQSFKEKYGTNLSLSQDGQQGQDSTENDGGAIQQELERLQDQLSIIEALEERNKAQLESFIDEEDQWNSMEEEEREFLKSKDSVIEQMELLTEQLVMLWMGQKSQDG